MKIFVKHRCGLFFTNFSGVVWVVDGARVFHGISCLFNLDAENSKRFITIKGHCSMTNILQVRSRFISVTKPTTRIHTLYTFRKIIYTYKIPQPSTWKAPVISVTITTVFFSLGSYNYKTLNVHILAFKYNQSCSKITGCGEEVYDGQIGVWSNQRRPRQMKNDLIFCLGYPPQLYKCSAQFSLEVTKEEK